MKVVFYAFLAVTLLFACNLNTIEVKEKFDSSALIVGQDFGACPCCGGYIIEIDDDNEIYRFEILPEDSSIDLKTDSISVQLNWTLNRECGNIKYIDIEKIRLN